jgi:Ca2+-binding EF-hand superfamily protein
LDNFKTLSQAEMVHLRSWFDSVDTDRSGEIDKNELSKMLMPGFGPFAGRTLGIGPATTLIKLFNRRNSDTIST